MAKTALALVEKPAPTAAERLAALETEAQPYRLRLLEITEELTTIVPGGGSIEDEVAARRKAADLELERGVVQGRLDPIEAQLVPARSEAKVEAAAALREEVASAGLAALADLKTRIAALAAEVEKLKAQATADARRGEPWRNSMALHTEVRKACDDIARSMNMLRALAY